MGGDWGDSITAGDFIRLVYKGAGRRSGDLIEAVAAGGATRQNGGFDKANRAAVEAKWAVRWASRVEGGG